MKTYYYVMTQLLCVCVCYRVGEEQLREEYRRLVEREYTRLLMASSLAFLFMLCSVYLLLLFSDFVGQIFSKHELTELRTSRWPIQVLFPEVLVGFCGLNCRLLFAV